MLLPLFCGENKSGYSVGSCACVLGGKKSEDRLCDQSWTAGLKAVKDLSEHLHAHKERHV